MRVNIYGEELTDEVELVTKEVTDDTFGTRTFYGLRVFLKSPPELHAHPDDDDRSAITFWVPWTRQGGQDPTVLWKILLGLDVALSRVTAGADRVPAPLLDPPIEGDYVVDE